MRLQGITFGALAAICAFGITSAPAPADADTVTLKNGREIYGRLVEEKEESIRIRTSGGTITISKAEVATFSENESLEPPKKRKTAREIELEERAKKAAEERAKEGEGEGEGDKGGRGDKGEGGGSKVDAENWTWAEDVSDERIDALTPIRDQLLEELKKLGPTKEERLEKLKLTSSEAADLKERIATLGTRTNRRRRANLQRENALKGILSTYGLKAFQRLSTALSSNNLWTRRLAARGLADLAGQGEEGEAEWLFWNFATADGLLALMDHQGEFDSPNIRKDGYQAFTKFVKTRTKFPVSDSAISTPAESQAHRDISKASRKAGKSWAAKQEKNGKLREELNGKLDQVRKGETPEGFGDEGDDDDDARPFE